MGFVYRKVIRPALFSVDSEVVHDWAVQSLGRVSRSALCCDALADFFAAPRLPVKLRGLEFPNPVGLAAGMDKAAVAVPAWEALGFGFVELGGVTWHAQPGNEKPRMFRIVEERALVNRMGFNNPGAQAMAERLERWKAAGRWPRHPVGMNLGKSKVTPLEKAAEDYVSSFRALRGLVDFFVVNVSSPNTPGLRGLQDKGALDEILAALQDENERGAVQARENSSRTHPNPLPQEREKHASVIAETQSLRLQRQIRRKPIMVKVAPDLSWEVFDELLEVAEARKVAGIVATNTKPNSEFRIQNSESGAGGISGRPLRQRSTEVIRHVYRQTGGKLPIIGVGGIFSTEDAWEKITAGASLVQLYTGLVYEGPGVVKEIVMGLAERVIREGFGSIEEAVGTGKS